jgi:hypothetical protein
MINNCFKIAYKIFHNTLQVSSLTKDKIIDDKDLSSSIIK